MKISTHGTKKELEWRWGNVSSNVILICQCTLIVIGCRLHIFYYLPQNTPSDSAREKTQNHLRIQTPWLVALVIDLPCLTPVYMYLFGCMIIITLLNFITPAPPPGQKCLQKWILTWPCCCAVSCRQQSCNRWDRINHCACIRVIACVSSPSFTVILTPPFVSVCPLALQ